MFVDKELNSIASRFEMTRIRRGHKFRIQTATRISVLKVIVLSWVVVLSCFGGCATSAGSHHVSARQDDNVQSYAEQTKDKADMTSVGDHELIKLIDDSVGGDFRALTAASERLASYPKQDLIERILRIRQGFSELDRRQISLAFVLCELDWEYESNKHLIVSDFAKEPHQQNLNADWEAWLINRLIRRGDKGLLPVLFNATKWSDGALSTDLSGMMVEHVKDEASTFVAALATVDEKTRQRVYSFINVRDLNYNDLAKIKKTLSSYSSDSANNVVARELLRFLRKAS